MENHAQTFLKFFISFYHGLILIESLTFNLQVFGRIIKITFMVVCVWNECSFFLYLIGGLLTYQQRVHLKCDIWIENVRAHVLIQMDQKCHGPSSSCSNDKGNDGPPRRGKRIPKLL